jgi:hypothetical protein
MADAAVSIKIHNDIEYKALGNGIGLLVALFGLLAGAMVTHCSLDYWREDLVPLMLVVIMGMRLFRNFIETLTVEQLHAAPHPHHPEMHGLENVHPEGAVAGQIPAVSSFSEEKVVEEVVKRIEAQKAEAARKNK